MTKEEHDRLVESIMTVPYRFSVPVLLDYISSTPALKNLLHDIEMSPQKLQSG